MKKYLLISIALFCAACILYFKNPVATESRKNIKQQNSKAEDVNDGLQALAQKKETDKAQNAFSSLKTEVSESGQFNAFDEVLVSCREISELSDRPTAEQYLLSLRDLSQAALKRCGNVITKYHYKFNLVDCLNSVEKMNQTNNHTDAHINCSSLLMLRSWNKYNKLNLNKKTAHAMTKEELADAYHAAYFDGRLKPEKRMETAYLFAVELLKRNPEDLPAINMLIRSSMIQNEKGNGYDDTLTWIKKAIRLDPRNEALVNHVMQRLAYDERYGIHSINKALELDPGYLTAQIIYAMYTFKTDAELLSYYEQQKKKYPHQLVQYNEIISHIKRNEDYFFRVVDFNLDTVPEYM